jgi:hypothetical protein
MSATDTKTDTNEYCLIRRGIRGGALEELIIGRRVRQFNLAIVSGGYRFCAPKNLINRIAALRVLG